MSAEIFEHWFKHNFVPHVKNFLDEKKLPHKALLLIDNAPSHPDESVLSVGEIKAMFFPPNVTSLIQPMDQGVISAFTKRSS